MRDLYPSPPSGLGEFLEKERYTSVKNHNARVDKIRMQARFVIHQSLTTTVVLILVPLSNSTLSPNEDLQYAVETPRSISQQLS